MSIMQRYPRTSRLTLCFVALAVLVAGLVVSRGSGQAAPSAKLSPLETRVLGQSQWLCGGPASLRVITTDHQADVPVRAAVAINLVRLNDGKPTANSIGVLVSSRAKKLGCSTLIST